jgi:hypothetical protein
MITAWRKLGTLLQRTKRGHGTVITGILFVRGHILDPGSYGDAYILYCKITFPFLIRKMQRQIEGDQMIMIVIESWGRDRF